MGKFKQKGKTSVKGDIERTKKETFKKKKHEKQNLEQVPGAVCNSLVKISI